MIAPKTIQLADEAKTKALAQRLAPHLKRGDVIALQGDLGAGKTAFARALIQAVCTDATDVPSPTFTLVQTYEAPCFEIWHFDLYRIAFESEIDELGFEEALETAVSVIEWPDRLGTFLPSDRLEITLFMGSDTIGDADSLGVGGASDRRVAQVRAFGDTWRARLNDVFE